MKAFIIASPFSGSGKTTLTMGIMAALRSMGYTVQPFKVGPDYIDPIYHRAVCGRPSYNLDTWMMGDDGVRDTFLNAMEGADIGVIEGVMGLFDGKDGGSGAGSTALTAKVLNIPVILVVDASKMGQSIAPLVYGYERFDREIRIIGVILNRVGSQRHLNILKCAIEDVCNTPVIGYLFKDGLISIDERHLGLSIEPALLKDRGMPSSVDRLKGMVMDNVRIGSILELSRLKDSNKRASDYKEKTSARPMTRIGIAYDEAFCFYYQENIDILRDAGAELVTFSPLHDRHLPDELGGLYIGGGYPELYARALETNTSLRVEIKGYIERGMPVYAECGGLIYLGREVVDLNGRRFDMVGIFPWNTSMDGHIVSLGYVEVEVLDGLPFLKAGDSARGHEFRYSSIDMEEERSDIRSVYRLTENSSINRHNSIEGFLYKNTLASYIHLHFASNRCFAKGFVKECGLFMSGERTF